MHCYVRKTEIAKVIGISIDLIRLMHFSTVVSDWLISLLVGFWWSNSFSALQVDGIPDGASQTLSTSVRRSGCNAPLNKSNWMAELVKGTGVNVIAYAFYRLFGPVSPPLLFVWCYATGRNLYRCALMKAKRQAKVIYWQVTLFW